jgi:hypothetical protein
VPGCATPRGPPPPRRGTGQNLQRSRMQRVGAFSTTRAPDTDLLLRTSALSFKPLCSATFALVSAARGRSTTSFSGSLRSANVMTGARQSYRAPCRETHRASLPSSSQRAALSSCDAQRDRTVDEVEELLALGGVRFGRARVTEGGDREREAEVGGCRGERRRRVVDHGTSSHGGALAARLLVANADAADLRSLACRLRSARPRRAR